MKNITLTLMSIMAGMLLVRYNPYMSKNLLVDYVKSAYLSYQDRNLVNSKNTK